LPICLLTSTVFIYGEDEKDERTTLYVPAYQRKFVWDNKKKSRFIESVFLGISLMPFLVSESSDKKLEIIDGSQRIRTLITFYNGGFKLKGLKKLTKDIGQTSIKLTSSFNSRTIS
jgi:uncharacterized protein with ParB-like and HNH nuclease domain